MANLGFIGVGIMGKPMAGHLMTAGHTVHVYDVVPAGVKELVGKGGLYGNVIRITPPLNIGRADVDEFARHHALEIDAGISSFHHGKTKPHASIFSAVLDLLEVAPAEALMVGDTLEDDVEGARAVGMQALLLDDEALDGDNRRTRHWNLIRSGFGVPWSTS